MRNPYLDGLWRAQKRGVPAGPEFARISNLPTRDPAALPQPPTEWLEQWRLPGCADPRCNYHKPPRPIQSAALWEGHQHHGAFLPIGCGGGKALLSFLFPTVLGAKKPLLIVPHSLMEQTRRIYQDLRQHWVLVAPEITSYWLLARPEQAQYLESLRPDAYIFDEVHQILGAPGPMRKRFEGNVARRRKAGERIAVVGMSGTPLKKALSNWAPFAYLALQEGSPAPRDFATQRRWGYALDDLGDMDNGAPGVLATWAAPGESTRDGYRRRVISTPGVVASTKMECDASIVMHPWTPRIPKPLSEALATLRRTWTRPDSEEFGSALDFRRHAHTLALGLYLRWVETPPAEWLEARAAWNREVRSYLGRRSRPGLDSPGLYEDAVLAGTVQSAAYATWASLRDAYVPVTEPVWVTPALLDAAAKWLESHGPAVAWTATPEFGAALAAKAGVPYYGAGPEAAAAILDVDFSRSAVCSIDAHGTGRNLQGFAKCLVLEVPAGGDAWEQLIARFHRAGQASDVVEVYVAQHTPELVDAFDNAVRNARYHKEGGFGLDQRLLAATITWSNGA